MKRVLSLLLALLISCGNAWAQERDPVAKTPLATEGRSLQTGIVSPTNGLATYIADIYRAQSQAKALNNLQMLRRGVWTSKGIGWTKQRAGSFNGGAAFMDFAAFVDGAGTQTLCFQVGSRLYSYNLGTSTETAMITGLSTSALPCMRNFAGNGTTTAPYLIYCNGAIQPQRIDNPTVPTVNALQFIGETGAADQWNVDSFNGVTYSQPAFCEPYGQRMAYAGFTGNQIAFDVLISRQGDAETFTDSSPLVATDAIAFKVPPILGPIRGMRSFKLSNESNDEVLLVGCASGMAIITGDNATNYSMRILTRQHGILSNRCWTQIDNNLYYLATDGVRNFYALASNANLLSSSLTYPLQDIINRIDTTSATKAHCINHMATQEVQWWIPLTGDSAQCSHALIMNYNNESSSSGGVVTPVWSSKDGTSVACSFEFGGVMYGGSYDGFLQTHYSGDLYNTTPIVFDYITPLIGVGNPAQTSSVRKAIVICDGEDQDFLIRPYYYTRLGSGNTIRRAAVPAEAELASTGTGSTTLGSGSGAWTLGTSLFPANHVKTLDFQPSGNGLFWEYEITANSASHKIDLVGLQFIQSGGGIQR